MVHHQQNHHHQGACSKHWFSGLISLPLGMGKDLHIYHLSRWVFYSIKIENSGLKPFPRLYSQAREIQWNFGKSSLVDQGLKQQVNPVKGPLWLLGRHIFYLISPHYILYFLWRDSWPFPRVSNAYINIIACLKPNMGPDLFLPALPESTAMQSKRIFCGDGNAAQYDNC